MSTSIMETLQNAHINLIENEGHTFPEAIGRMQLHNAVRLLEKNYGLDADVDDLLDEHQSVESVPEKE